MNACLACWWDGLSLRNSYRCRPFGRLRERCAKALSGKAVFTAPIRQARGLTCGELYQVGIKFYARLGLTTVRVHYHESPRGLFRKAEGSTGSVWST